METITFNLGNGTFVGAYTVMPQETEKATLRNAAVYAAQIEGCEPAELTFVLMTNDFQVVTGVNTAHYRVLRFDRDGEGVAFIAIYSHHTENE